MINYKHKIQCTLMRGGTSKGLMFLAENLPELLEDKLAVIRQIMGVPDTSYNQVHGIGSGKSTNNKVGIISKSTKNGVDIDYLFMQLNPATDFVDMAPNCGNFISAVPVFALFKDLISPTINSDKTIIRIFNQNTNQLIHAKIPTNNNGAIISGNTAISGVNGLFSKIELEFFNVVGSKTGKLFPLDKRVSLLDGIRFSVTDVSVPMILVDGDTIGITKDSDMSLLKSPEILDIIHKLRKFVGDKIGVSDIEHSVIPKVAIITKSDNYDIKSFYYDPFVLHDSHAVTGAMNIAASCMLKGSIAYEKYLPKESSMVNLVQIEHISGYIEAIVDIKAGTEMISSCSFIRTAAVLMDGETYIY